MHIHIHIYAYAYMYRAKIGGIGMHSDMRIWVIKGCLGTYRDLKTLGV